MSTDNGSEVEVKFKIADLSALERRLRDLGFEQKTPPTREVNDIYDDSRRTLRTNGELLRLRCYGDRWKLTYKGKAHNGRHKTRRELETEVADGEAMRSILTALGFSAVFRYEKFRSEWTDGKGEVVVDRTPIGNIAEIEGSPEWIDMTAERLGVEQTEFITKSYASLFFEWKSSTNSPAENMTFQECGTDIAGVD